MNTNALVLSVLVALAAPLLAPPTEAHAKGHVVREAYPMAAPEFRKKIEARIDRVRAVIDRKLDSHAVSPERKKAIHAMIDEAAKEVREALAQATADGTVTESEAGKVKALALELRGKVRERMRADKGGKGGSAEGGAKGKKGKKDPADKGGKAPAPPAATKP